MTECYSARCQQDRKSVRREFNKWTKNLLLQIGKTMIELKKKRFVFKSVFSKGWKQYQKIILNLMLIYSIKQMV
jgi:hypothetical protein